MLAGFLKTILYGEYMLKRVYMLQSLSWILDQSMLPIQWSSFSQRLYSIKKLLGWLPLQWSSLSKGLYSIKKISGGYQYNGLLFGNTQTQRNLVSKLHLLHKNILQVSFNVGSTIY